MKITGNELVAYTNDDEKGLTLKQYYTGVAVQGILANPRNSDEFVDNDLGWLNRQQIASVSVEIADAIIAELNKS